MDVYDEANLALDKYIEYFVSDGNDDEYNEELRWSFIEAAVEILEKITERKMADELVY